MNVAETLAPGISTHVHPEEELSPKELEESADSAGEMASSEEFCCEEFCREDSLDTTISEGNMSESESMELFQPSSPFTVKEEFILPDIMEEAEEAETESASLEAEVQERDAPSPHSSLDDGELDIEETNFSNGNLFSSVHETLGGNEVPETSPLNFNPPRLPVSPPPGPLLSPELEVVSEQPTASITESPRLLTRVKYNPMTSRHSMMEGMLNDLPPPLPITQPPGKLIPPRQSRYLDLVTFTTTSQAAPSNSERQHNVAEEATDQESCDVQTRESCDAQTEDTRIHIQESHDKQTQESCDTQTQESCDSRTQESCDSQTQESCDTQTEADNAATTREFIPETQSVKSDDILILLPPLEEHMEGDFSDSDLVRQRLGSHHLETYEPPKEFSDSGYQDTDTAATNTPPPPPPPPTPPPNIESLLANQSPGLGFDAEDTSIHSPVIMISKLDSSATCTSDEQLTENSGSVGPKTVISSGSEVRVHEI